MTLSIHQIKRNTKEHRYIDDPIAFAADVMGFHPDEQQKPILTNYLKNKFTSVKSGHGTGKSALASICSCHFLATRPFSVIPTTAPSAHQLSDVLWKEHAKWIARSEYLSSLFEVLGEKIIARGSINGVPNAKRWYAVARTSRTSSSDITSVGLQGSHAGKQSGGLLYVVDEASGVPESAMSAIEGALTEDNNYIFMAGNPTHLVGTFYDSFHKDKSLWTRYTLSCLNSSIVDPSYPKRMADKYGIDSDMYRIKVLGEFPKAEFSGLVPMHDILFAFQDHEVFDGEGVVIGGLDVALGGVNRTVLYLRVGGKVFHKELCGFEKEEEIATWVVDRIKKFHICRLCIDNIGPGSGVLSHLRKMGYKKICFGIKGGSSPVGKNADKEYFNLRAQMYWSLGNLFKTASIYLCYGKDDPMLRSQLVSIRVKQSRGLDRIQIESKVDMAKRGMPSPDEADALTLCFYDEITKKRKPMREEKLQDMSFITNSPWSVYGGNKQYHEKFLGMTKLSMVKRSRMSFGQSSSRAR